jgi:hypothetical protein
VLVLATVQYLKGTPMLSPIKLTALFAIVALGSACSKGANEEAGAAADTSVEAATGEVYPGDGPKEDRGEKIDDLQKEVADEKSDLKNIQADRVRTEAETKADAIKNKADAVRKSAETKADVMENKADTVRDAAEKKADKMEDQADKARP